MARLFDVEHLADRASILNGKGKDMGNDSRNGSQSHEDESTQVLSGLIEEDLVFYLSGGTCDLCFMFQSGQIQDTIRTRLK